MNFRIAHISSILFAGFILNAHADAQFGDLIDKLKGQVIKTAAGPLGVGMPLVLDQKSAFAKISDLPDFNARMLEIKSADDIHMRLDAGDYAVPVIAYSAEWSIHAPGKGLPYKLARVKGKLARAISTILVRGTLRGVPAPVLNQVAWNIEDGLPLNRWNRDDKELVHDIAPEYEKQLDGDFIQKARDIFEKANKVSLGNIPTFDDFLLKFGVSGKLFADLLSARDKLADMVGDAAQLPDKLYEPTGDNLPRVLPAEENPQPSPWAEIRPGVFGRLFVDEGDLGRNILEVRVTDRASQPGIGKQVELGWVLGILADAGEKAPPKGDPEELIGYSIGQPAQALMLMLYIPQKN